MIVINNLKKLYNQTTVLDDISFDVRPGEIFGIVGHSGAGKSTLLRCLNGLEPYQEGSLKIMGQEVKSLSGPDLLKLRREMGMVFQTFNLMSRKNVFENVAFPLQVWRVPSARRKERVMELLELVGLTDKCHARVGNLSGGQKQRVGIARALALNPKILLCDEATSALDPKTTQSILDLLQDVNKRFGLTIIVVTHQMEVVKRLCHRVLLLDKGREQALGLTDKIFLHPTENIKKLVEDEYTLIPTGTNIRIMFPRELSQKSVIITMARELDVDFSIVGGRLERYQDDMLGFSIINVADEHLEIILNYLQSKNLFWEVMENG